jgi:hypothetical protein
MEDEAADVVSADFFCVLGLPHEAQISVRTNREIPDIFFIKKVSVQTNKYRINIRAKS